MSERANPEAIQLSLPAGGEYAIVASMALSGVGVVAGLDVDTIGDLRTVAAECLDCLAHQRLAPARVSISAWRQDGHLHMRFEALDRREGAGEDGLDLDITCGVLETLMPDVRLLTDEGGVWGIECSMPA